MGKSRNFVRNFVRKMRKKQKFRYFFSPCRRYAGNDNGTVTTIDGTVITTMTNSQSLICCCM
mgnify:FL=1